MKKRPLRFFSAVTALCVVSSVTIGAFALSVDNSEVSAETSLSFLDVLAQHLGCKKAFAL